jgi:hypothetical protein
MAEYTSIKYVVSYGRIYVYKYEYHCKYKVCYNSVGLPL